MESLTHYFRRIIPTLDLVESDDRLLTRFLESNNPEAVTTLVERHGPMVWSTCRRILDREADAEDAFQATFLVFAKKANTVRPRNMLAGWLHGVAVNVALKVRSHAMRRTSREKTLEEFDVPEPSRTTLHEDDVKRLDEAIAKLPLFLREPLILCELEGVTRKNASQILGIPEGTVASRVSRAKKRLAFKLGVPSLTVMAWNGIANHAPASADLFFRTAEAAVGFSVAAPTTASAVAVAQEVLFDMFIRKLKILAVVAIGTMALAIGAGYRFDTPAKADTPKTSSASRANDLTAKVLRPTDLVNFQLLSSEAVRKDLGLGESEANTIADAFAKAEALWRQKAKTNVAVNQAGVVINQAVNAVPGVPIMLPPGGVAPAVPALPMAAMMGARPAGQIAVVGAPLAREAMIVGVGETIYQELFGEKSEFMTTLKPILTEKRIHRLRQLELTSTGANAFTNRRVVRYLALTEEQEDSIELSIKKWKADSRQLNFKKKEQHETQDTALAACVALLTAEQKQKWDLLAGKTIPAFDLLNFDRGVTQSGIVFTK